MKRMKPSLDSSPFLKISVHDGQKGDYRGRTGCKLLEEQNNLCPDYR